PAHRHVLSFPTRRPSDLTVRSVGHPADLRAVQRGTGYGHLRLPRAPVQRGRRRGQVHRPATECGMTNQAKPSLEEFFGNAPAPLDRKSTRLNSSHVKISY